MHQHLISDNQTLQNNIHLEEENENLFIEILLKN